jgi:hypothetical protein
MIITECTWLGVTDEADAEAGIGGFAFGPLNEYDFQYRFQ